MRLEIVTPDMTLFSGEVDSVSLPGAAGMFMVLENHAPLYSLLRDGGTIAWSSGDGADEVLISGGFVEVLDNRVTACVETPAEKRNTEE